MQSGGGGSSTTFSLAPVDRLSDTDQMIFRIGIVQTVASGCCDFIAQCIMVCININHLFYSPKFSKIYRCWIVWDKNIRLVIIPSFLAIAYIGQSIYLYMISRFQFTASSYLARVRFSIDDSEQPLQKHSNNRGYRRQMDRRIYGNELLFISGFPGPTFGSVHDNKLRFVHDRECPDDDLDRVQDPQSILGS